MINFRNREDRGASILILLAILILFGSLIYVLAVPEPSAAGIAKGRTISRQKIEQEIETVTRRTREVRAAVKKRLWQGEVESVTALVLQKLTAQANQRSLKITAFRPQKGQLIEGMTELPFSVQLTGAFPNVSAMLKGLDAPNTNITLRSVQIASSDGVSSLVTATLGLSVYIESAAPSKPAVRSGGSRDKN
jgi:Tfp pilus assembly protein PilO